ncbi:MAG: NUDIX hydrolase [Herpetosiphonaceae bacterium]|nr:NUDIX hydrolase [Herpetosiphonaceae bacterium]
MISFDHPQGRFSHRTVGVIIQAGRVLLHRAENEHFWTLPGGRVEFGEHTSAALLREIGEELEVAAQVERLLWVVENFFVYQGRQTHELAFYFLLTLPPDCGVYQHTQPFEGDEEGVKLIFQWFALDQLAEIVVYPAFLAHTLPNLPPTMQHLVHHHLD